MTRVLDLYDNPVIATLGKCVRKGNRRRQSGHRHIMAGMRIESCERQGCHGNGSRRMDMSEDASIRFQECRVTLHSHIELHVAGRLPIAILNSKLKAVELSSSERGRFLPNHTITIG